MARALTRRPATPTERARASKLRAKARAGTIAKKDAAWLARYDASRAAFAVHRSESRARKRARKSAGKRPTRIPSARKQAERIALWAARFITSADILIENEFVFESEWVRPSRPGRPGIARAAVFWDTPAMPPDETLPDPMTVANVGGRRLANVRVLVAYLDEDDRIIETAWTSLTALTSRWPSIRGDVRSAALDLGNRPSIKARREKQDLGELEIGIIATSAQVSPRRENANA